MKLAKLSEVCTIVNGGTPKTGVGDYWGGEILWITPKDLGKIRGSYADQTERTLTQLGIDSSSAKIIPEKSLILSTRAPIGHVAMNTRPMSFNQGCKGLIPSDAIDVKYLYYFLIHSKQLLNELGRGTTFLELSNKALSNVKVPLPPIHEQRHIVAKLDAAFDKIDQAINLTKQNIESAKSLIYANMRDLLSSAQGANKVVGDILRLEYGKPLDKTDRIQTGRFAAYGANGIKDRTDRFYWDRPSIIVGRKGSAGELTRVNEPFWPLDVTYYVVHDSSETDLSYLYSLLKSLNLPSFARGVKPGVNRNDIYTLDITLPSLDDQVKIARKIDVVERDTKQLNELYDQKLKMLNDFKQSMLSEAFSESAVK